MTTPSPGTVATPSPLHEVVLRGLLTHPLALAAKRPLRDAWWLVRGMALTNPPLPARVASILFVCKGNICRSPFAAARAARLLEEAGGAGIRCSSAGITTTQAARPPAEACEAASTFGCSLAAHEPLQLTRETIASHDVTVVMEAEQLIYLRGKYPELVGRLFLLSLLDDRAAGGYAKYNITDPFGQDLATFRRCYERIDAALTRMLRTLCVSS